MAAICTAFQPRFLFLILCYVTLPLVSPNSEQDIDWEKYFPPTCFGDLNYRLPKNVIDLNISVGIQAIYEISEEKMEFGMQLDLYEIWEDPFLKIPITKANFNRSAMLVPQKVIDCIWKPDTAFLNAKEERLYDQTSQNVFYKIVFRNSEYVFILKKSRYKLTVACPMKFEYYPMDSQSCFLRIGLFHSRKHEVRLQWSNGVYDKISLKKDETPLNFEVKQLPRTKSEFQYQGVSVVMEYLNANFLFERSLSASVFNTYIPSFLVVCLSMVSFWLDVNAVPGRVTLGVTAILTLSTQIVQARSGLPILDYMTAMDVWLLGCLIMVFLSLVEFTFANSNVRRECLDKARKDILKDRSATWADDVSESILCVKCRSVVQNTRINNTKSGKKLNCVNVVKTNIVKDNVLDRISRIVFPICLLIFSCTYWLYYYRRF